MTSDEVSCTSAARGVIAININGLLAHSTVDYTLEQRYSESVRHAYTEVAGAKDGVVPVLFGGNSSEETTRVWLGNSEEPLTLALVWSSADQVLQRL